MNEPRNYSVPQQFLEDVTVPARWRVWVIINGFFISGQYCWASNEWIAEKIKSHKDTVSQAVAELEKLKIVRCERGARSRAIYPMIGANAYQWSVSTPISDRHQRLSNSVSISEREQTSVAYAPQVYEIVPEQQKPKKESNAKYPHSKEVFGLWGDYPRNWVTNRTQLQAAENLYTELGLEETKKGLALYKRFESEEFCPAINSPYDLDSKWDKLLDFKKRYEKKNR